MTETAVRARKGPAITATRSYEVQARQSGRLILVRVAVTVAAPGEAGPAFDPRAERKFRGHLSRKVAGSAVLLPETLAADLHGVARTIFGARRTVQVQVRTVPGYLATAAGE